MHGHQKEIILKHHSLHTVKPIWLIYTPSIPRYKVYHFLARILKNAS
jgi:hypothetical protein